jgi:phospholipase C
MKKQPPNDNEFNASRRRLLTAALAGTAGSAVLSACSTSAPVVSETVVAPVPAALPVNPALPDPATSGIDHIVVVMMENRSFDHYFGWLPGADGVQAGRSFVDKNGKTQSSFHLTDFQNCASADPDHSYEGGRIELAGGAMNGFLQTATTVPPDMFPIGYYSQGDLSFFGQAVGDWTVCDRYFCSILAETYPNRFYMHSGETDRLHNSDNADTGGSTSVLPTIWDALQAKGLTGTYYYSDIPFTAEWGTKYLNISQPFATFLAQAAAGTLPSVSYIDPTFLGESNGVSHDDHPLADIRNGQAFLSQVYNAIVNSPQYANTLLIFNYDEWGGFADHVVPPFAPISAAEAKLGNDGRLGFRVPNMLVGPRVKRGHIEHTQFDHTSVLNLIAWRFGLTPFYPRAATSNNLALALDFSNPPNTAAAPTYTVPPGPFGQECDIANLMSSSSSSSSNTMAAKTRAAHIFDMQSLKLMAQRNGFTIY